MSETLRESEFFRLASEHAPYGIVVQDMAGRILWSNPAFSKIHNRPAHEVLGKHPLEFALPVDRTPDAKDIAKFSYVPGDSRLDGFEIVENQRASG
ncbi:MAG: PAS domain S-box protein [Octadecabacter sp.]|nr:PAS domain S-box protein [Octadecabacter sp.]